jgi:four helix bundle protein
MVAAIKDFRELRVYRMAFDSAMAIFDRSKGWPAEERFSLTDQIRRSSRSVCANIAEAWRKRRYVASFISKLSDADTEAGETLVWLEFALQCGYLDEQDHKTLTEKYDHICGQLVTMMNQKERWCVK